MTNATLNTQCCIAGGGPAGMMLGFLLARAGVKVDVLEKHADFLRDFRGDTVHPSTLEVMHELGLLDEFLTLPHEKVYRLGGIVGETPVNMADFSRLRVHAPFVAFMPQWDFLNFMAKKATAYPNFRLHMQAEATELLAEGEKIIGVRAKTPQGDIEIRSDLVIGADGRHSTVRAQAGLQVRDFGAPIDVLWFRISRKAGDAPGTLGRIRRGSVMALINRGEYWQCGYVIAKGVADSIRQQGLDAFRRRVVENAPFFNDRMHELDDWEKIKLLTVKVDCLTRWHRDGLLCIGDAAHAMSPVGGVGINLAIQDAVAAANILAKPLRDGNVTETMLAAVQKRRLWPARMTQRIQIFLHKRVFERVLQSDRQVAPPFIVKYLNRIPVIGSIPARLVGIGFRPEHVK